MSPARSLPEHLSTSNRRDTGATHTARRTNKCRERGADRLVAAWPPPRARTQRLTHTSADWRCSPLERGESEGATLTASARTRWPPCLPASAKGTRIHAPSPASRPRRSPRRRYQCGLLIRTPARRGRVTGGLDSPPSAGIRGGDRRGFQSLPSDAPSCGAEWFICIITSKRIYASCIIRQYTNAHFHP